MNPTPERIKELESHSAMLGQIAGYVEEYAQDERMTTLEVVRWVVASYKKLLAEKELDSIMEKVRLRHRD